MSTKAMDCSNNDNEGWEPCYLNSIDEVLKKLKELSLHNRQWLFRGQSKPFGKIIPSIDRDPLDKLVDRHKKLEIENQSIQLFKQIVRMFPYSKEEQFILPNPLASPIGTISVLQHYSGITRFVDWTFSPYIAAYFSVCENDKCPGEIWGFDEKYYEQVASCQWEEYPETKVNGSFDNDLTTAFEEDNTHDWFVCQFLPFDSFPRYEAQSAAFTFTSQFGRDHAKCIKTLFNNSEHHRLYILNIDKLEFRRILKEDFSIWYGSLFPDTFGAAIAIREVLHDKARLEENKKNNPE